MGKKEVIKGYLYCNVICDKQKRVYTHTQSLNGEEISGRIHENLNVGSEICSQERRVRITFFLPLKFFYLKNVVF